MEPNEPEKPGDLIEMTQSKSEKEEEKSQKKTEGRKKAPHYALGDSEPSKKIKLYLICLLALTLFMVLVFFVVISCCFLTKKGIIDL